MNTYMKMLAILSGVLLQVLLIEAEQVPGTPGVDYPTYFEIPKTSFRCSQQKYIPGFYADTETGCQVFHSCYKHRQESYLCPTGTTFNQAILACDYWYSSNCSLAPLFYNVNAYDKHEISEVRSYPMHTYSEDVFNKMASLYESSSALPPSEQDSGHNPNDDSQRNSMPEIEFEEKAEITEEKDQESLDFERYFQITRNTGGLSFHEMINDLYPSPDRVFPPRKIKIPLPGSHISDNTKFKEDEFLSKAEDNSEASDNKDKKNVKEISNNKRQDQELDSIKYEGQMLDDIVRRDGILSSASDDKVVVDRTNSGINRTNLRLPLRRRRIQIVAGSKILPLSKLELSNDKSDLPKNEAKIVYLNEQVLESPERNREASKTKFDSKPSDLLNHGPSLQTDESQMLDNVRIDKIPSGASNDKAVISTTDSAVSNTKMRLLSRRRRIQMVAAEENQPFWNSELSKDIKLELLENKAELDHLKEQTIESDPVGQFKEQNKDYFDFPVDASDDKAVIASGNSDSSQIKFRPSSKRRRSSHQVAEPAPLSESSLPRSEESVSQGRENSRFIFSDESLLLKNIDTSEFTEPFQETDKSINLTDYFPSKELVPQDEGRDWVPLEKAESSDERRNRFAFYERNKENKAESYTSETGNASEKDLLPRHSEFFANRQVETKASASDFNREFIAHEAKENSGYQGEDSGDMDSERPDSFRGYSLESFPEEMQEWIKSQFGSGIEQHQSEKANQNEQFFYLTDGDSLLEAEHFTEADYNTQVSEDPGNIGQVKRSEHFEAYKEKSIKDQYEGEEVSYEYVTISPEQRQDILNRNEQYFYASDNFPEAEHFEEADYAPEFEGYEKQDFPAGKYENVHYFDLPREYPSQKGADEMTERLRAIPEDIAHGRLPSVPSEAIEESEQSSASNTSLPTSSRTSYQIDESEVQHAQVPFETVYISEDGEFYDIYSHPGEQKNVEYYQGSNSPIFSNGAILQGAEISRTGHTLDPTMPGLIYTGLYATSKLNYDFGIPLEKDDPTNAISLHDILYGNADASNISHVVEPSMPQLVYTGLRAASEVDFDFKDPSFEIGSYSSSQETNAELSVPKDAEDSKASETSVETNSEMVSSVDTSIVNSTLSDVDSAEKSNKNDESDGRGPNVELKTVHVSSDFESATVDYKLQLTQTQNPDLESSEAPASQDKVETPEGHDDQKQAVMTDQITSHDTSYDSDASSNAPLHKIGSSAENFDSSSKKVLEDSLDSLNFKDDISDEEFYALLAQIASADPNSELHSSKEKEIHTSSSGKTGPDLIGTNIKKKTNKSPEMGAHMDGSAVKFPSEGKGKLKSTRKIDSSSMPSEMMYLNNPGSSSFQAYNQFSGFPTGYQQFSPSTAFSSPAQANSKTNQKKSRRPYSRKPPSSTNFSKLKSFANKLLSMKTSAFSVFD